MSVSQHNTAALAMPQWLLNGKQALVMPRVWRVKQLCSQRRFSTSPLLFVCLSSPQSTGLFSCAVYRAVSLNWFRARHNIVAAPHVHLSSVGAQDESTSAKKNTAVMISVWTEGVLQKFQQLLFAAHGVKSSSGPNICCSSYKLPLFFYMCWFYTRTNLCRLATATTCDWFCPFVCCVVLRITVI